MTVELLDVPAPKTRKRASAKTSVGTSADRQKVTIVLSADAHLRLAVHAAALRMDRSELVEKLLRENLRRFVLQDRGDRDSGEDRQTLPAA